MDADAAERVAGAGGARPGWFDTHCHLQDQYRDEAGSVADVAEAATAAGVVAMVCVGTDASTSRQAMAVVEELRGRPGSPESWATVGLHPHEASHGTDDVTAVLDSALSDHHDAVVAVGECGLDYHYDHSPRAVQRDAFGAQVALARRHGLTLVVHTRSAWDDTIAILRAEGVPERTVMHCFTGGPDEARRCLELGAYLSFSGIVTFKNADDVRQAAALCPSERLLVETDAPFLAPVPHRGETNRPALVAVVGAAVAAVRDVAPEVLADTSSVAARAAFALG